MNNFKFRRQTPIGPFIADFYCAAFKLVIELDGESHTERGEYDLRRQNWFRENGYRVLRFSNDEVLADEDSVLLGILKACGQLPEAST